MRANFPLFRSHLDLAHFWWERLLCAGDRVVDATAGNGHDLLKLAQTVLSGDEGVVWGLDVKEEALESSRHRLDSQLTEKQMERVYLECGCHSVLPEEATDLKLVVYNLGYLPGGNKAETTQTATTLKSLDCACERLQSGGAISVTCYPGHPEGSLEEAAILEWANKLPSTEWSVCHHRWLNREKAPSLLLVQKTEHES